MAKVRILIADDHPVVRRGLRTILEAEPEWEVCAEAVNGREAVQKAKRLKPDVAVLDITMPELNGLEATRLILKEAPQTEVLILTMHNSEEIVSQVLRAGARGFVLKSDADNELVVAVQALRAHKPYLTPGVTAVVLQRYLERAPEEDVASAGLLTLREREVVQLVSEGKSNKEVAVTLGVGVKTVEAHRSSVMHKLRLQSVSELVRYAIRNKIVEA